MPKLKSKSSAKKRFSITATGKVKAPQSGKRHNLSNKPQQAIRDLRGTTILEKGDSLHVKKWLPYGN